MALVWNTRQLLAHSGSKPAPVEFHYLSHRELYDNTIISVDRHHSSAGEWVIGGDQHWYTVSVVTRPVYALPQELCLSFDCFYKIETSAKGSWTGPPIEEVAAEFGSLLSLLAREPVLPLGVRRVDGKPIKFKDRYSNVPRLEPANPNNGTGVSSKEMKVEPVPEICTGR